MNHTVHLPVQLHGGTSTNATLKYFIVANQFAYNLVRPRLPNEDCGFKKKNLTNMVFSFDFSKFSGEAGPKVGHCFSNG